MSAPFTHSARIYWEDTDAGGIVYYANYLKFFERARTEWLRARGIEQGKLAAQTGGMFVVSRASVDYLRPARLDDWLIVTAAVAESGAASLALEQCIHLGAPDGPLLVQGRFRLAWVGAQDMRPARIPAAVRQKLRDLP